MFINDQEVMGAPAFFRAMLAEGERVGMRLEWPCGGTEKERLDFQRAYCGA